VTTNYAIERITTQFDIKEDRIRLTGALPGGDTVVVWLTRRLLGFLVPVLLERLEPLTPAVAAVATPAPADAYVELRKEFAQQAAREAIQPAAPVIAAAASGQLLPSFVDVTPSNGAISLRFRDEAGNTATFGVTETGLRQWLHLLYRADQSSAWALGVWPSWLRGDQQPARDPGMTVH
jgi:hypothetical protein